MSLLLQCLFWVAAFMVVGLALGAVVAWWIARGESDVNGDPERDSGLIGVERQLGPTVDHACRVECEWCHVVFSGPAPLNVCLCPACVGEAHREIEALRAK